MLFLKYFYHLSYITLFNFTAMNNETDWFAILFAEGDVGSGFLFSHIMVKFQKIKDLFKPVFFFAPKNDPRESLFPACHWNTVGSPL